MRFAISSSPLEVGGLAFCQAAMASPPPAQFKKVFAPLFSKSGHLLPF
jgi:hypothetical protein